ncbi:MAG: ABC transporter permease [Oscillospiraceae bacterium]|nr:ABC transporter permease [Oscillospiraceae bacterium]
MSTLKNSKGGKKGLLSGSMQNMVIILAAVVLFLVFYFINPSFASKGNLLTMAKSLVPYAILALGVTFVIATGGIDLSIGTVCIGSAVLAGALCKTGVSVEDGTLWLTIPVILASGILFGLINGLLVAKCKIAPFIATLGTMLVSRGLTAVISEAVRKTSSAVKYPTTGWFQKVFTNLNGFPIGIVWVLVLTIICMVVMYKTKIGRYILAIGSNEEAARLSGINTDKYKIIAYVIGGFFASLAALFYTAANPSLTIASGNGMELDAIAGVYIGGTSTTGGSASVLGTILGSMILVIIRQGLNLAMSGGSAVSATNITYAVTGVIVVGAVLLDVLKKKSAAKVKIDKKALKQAEQEKQTQV